MALVIEWTALARDDLAESARYIARDSHRYAQAFVEEVLAAAKSLGEWPKSGHVVPEFQDQTIREVPVRRHRLIYHVLNDRVVILGLLHGARRLESWWEGR